ncbi:PilN domain-containing protein [Undibacterium sp. SXout20W]|uniref:PilN domain-containing protein n=1 Tax=Undibacterium sp. SXout20W TaxID=3413051 RepID=UPI003BEFFAA0
MIKINLLPHREEKRKQQVKDFYSLLLLSAVVGALIAIVVGAINQSEISVQSDRVNFIKKENVKLDEKIKEIVDLKQEIDALKARQQAVEDLQGDRNQPVFLLSELVKYTPEGVYLESLKQEVQKVTVIGYAQSQERVADYIRNLSGKSEWMYQPNLIDIHSAGIGQGRDAKKVYEFTINVAIKRPREKDESASSAAANVEADKNRATPGQ